jgi:nitronate monooxygenase
VPCALLAAAQRAGSGDFSPSSSGRNATGCRDVPARQLVRVLTDVVTR